MKYYIHSGDIQEVIIANNPEMAIKKALNKIFKVSGIIPKVFPTINVSEIGFNTIGQIYKTKAMMDKFGIKY